MSTFVKMKELIMKQPTVKDIMPQELQSFLKRYGFILKRVRGDHFIYAFPSPLKEFVLPIPMAKPVKPTYIDQIRNIIIEVEGE